MGLIFGLAEFGILGVRYVVGASSDATGRKPFFVWSLGLAGISAAALPAFPFSVAIGALKLVRDAAGVVREAMRSIVVYEAAGSRFVKWIGRMVGSEFFFMALGAAATGVMIERAGYAWLFVASGACSIVSAGIIWRWLREERGVLPPVARSAGGRGAWLGLDLPPGLKVIAASSFVFNLGLFMSHNFYLLLFWRDKFHLDIPQLSLLQTFHRFSLGIPMLLIGEWGLRRTWQKHNLAICVVAMAAQGLCIALSGAIPVFPVAVGFFLIHDVIGAAVFSPILASFVQGYARPGQRGRDVAMVTGIGQLGGIIGPPLAGRLVDQFHWASGPYVFSGAFIVLAGLLMLRLPRPGRPS